MRGRLRSRGASTTRRLVCCGMLAVVVPFGLVWRLAPLHLPPFAFKYGGSALWAVAVYGALALVLPRTPPLGIGGRAAIVSLAVELGKLVAWAPLDRFRETLAGKLLLGRYFTSGAIAAYWLAIAIVMLLDSWLRPGLRTGDVPASPDEHAPN